MTSTDQQGLKLRLAAGGLLIVCAFAGFLWCLSVASVRLDYSKLPELDEGEVSTTYLTNYALRLSDLLRRDPSNGMIRNRYATVLARRHEYRKALDEHRRALKTHHTHDSLYFLGDMLDKLDQIEEAEQAMRRGAIINPADPKFNAAYLRILYRRLDLLRQDLRDQNLLPSPEFQQAWHDFAVGSRNWAIRAPIDKNSYLFLANYYVGPPLFALQAYRCFLLGLSQAPWMNLNPAWLIEPRQALAVISVIITGHWAPPYRELP